MSANGGWSGSWGQGVDMLEGAEETARRSEGRPLVIRHGVFNFGSYRRRPDLAGIRFAETIGGDVGQALGNVVMMTGRPLTADSQN